MFSNKNHGFIGTEGEKTSYFFHKNDFLGHWGDLVQDYHDRNSAIKVSFEPDKTPRGPRARNVRRLDFPNQAV